MPPALRIGERVIGDDHPCYVIAEMSANHGGSYERAVEIIEAASQAGADCIKVQTYTPDTITLDSDQECFQIKEGPWRGQTLHALYQTAMTPWDWQAGLKHEAESRGLDFLSTPFDTSAVDFLEDMQVNAYKIASFEIVDIPLVRYVAAKHKPMLVSTGMASLGEIEQAVNVIRQENNEMICLLKCSSAYPARPKDMHLNTMKNLKETFNVQVGFSDHSLGALSAIVAVALGAKVIEKHLCLSRKNKTPDSDFSMEPSEFKEMVDQVHMAEDAMGRIQYGATDQERASRLHRRSLFVSRDMKTGEYFTTENVRSVRPADGLPPTEYQSIIGKKARKDIKAGTPLRWTLIDD